MEPKTAKFGERRGSYHCGRSPFANEGCQFAMCSGNDMEGKAFHGSQMKARTN